MKKNCNCPIIYKWHKVRSAPTCTRIPPYSSRTAPVHQYTPKQSSTPTYSRQLLRMNVITFETCWAIKNFHKVTSIWFNLFNKQKCRLSCRWTALLKFMTVNNSSRQQSTNFSTKCHNAPLHTAAVSLGILAWKEKLQFHASYWNSFDLQLQPSSRYAHIKAPNVCESNPIIAIAFFVVLIDECYKF